MIHGDAAHFAAGPSIIAPQRQKRADFLNRKAEPSRAPNEAQLMNLPIAIIPVGILPPGCRLQQANRLIMPDHLGADPGLRRR